MVYLLKTTTMKNYSHIPYLRRSVSNSFETYLVSLLFIQNFPAHHFQMRPAPRPTALSKAVLLLREKIKNGEITADDNPKLMWLSGPMLMSYKLDKFCTRINKMKYEVLSDDGKYSKFYLILKYL